MKKEIKFVLFIIIVLFLLSGCTKSYVGGNYNLYTNVQNGYSYEVPLSFVQVSIPNNDVGFADNDTKLVFSSLGVPLNGASFDAVYNDFKSNLPRSLDAQILSEQKFVSNGNDARQLDLSYTKKESSFRYTVVLVYSEAKGKAVMITFVGPVLAHDSNLQVLRHTLDTLKFI